MREHLATLLLCAAAGLSGLSAGGCQKPVQPEPVLAAGPIPLNSFVRGWAQDLELRGDDRVKAVHLGQDKVYAYTSDGRILTMARDSGRLLWSQQIRRTDRGGMHPPVELEGRVVVMTSSTLEIFETTEGAKLKSVPLNLAARSDAVGTGNLIFLGGDVANAGRVIALDISKAHVHSVWQLMIAKGGLAATPALYDGVLYVGGGDGNVYALAADNREPLWPLKGSVFQTKAAIVADVLADDSGVYVASTDGNLYALNRGSGRLKWQYYGGTPLTLDPVATPETVYLPVPDAGVAAFSKAENDASSPQLSANRQPLWLAAGMNQFLSEDAQFAYLRRSKDNRIVALDKRTGKQMFVNHRRDLAQFATNTKGDGVIYVSTKQNRVLAIKPVLRPGMVGELVWNEQDLGEQALAAAKW
jgi:outer membrane protein assembly factor BamB